MTLSGPPTSPSAGSRPDVFDGGAAAAAASANVVDGVVPSVQSIVPPLVNRLAGR